MKITKFRYGKTHITGNMAFQGGKKEEKIPIDLLFFLIETGGKKILIDVGCDTMPGFILQDFQKPCEVLEAYGVSRDEITDILITHAHHDHIDALRYYKNANIVIHKNEEEAGRKYLPQGKSFITFDEDMQIAENITIKHIGGHSPGSSIVLVCDENKTTVFCGDECYLRENLTEAKPTGSSYDIEKSIEFVREYSKPQYNTVLSHILK